jgi:hypothetical protein
LGALNGGGFAGAVGAQEGGDLTPFGNKGQATYYAEHLAIEGRERPNVLD